MTPKGHKRLNFDIQRYKHTTTSPRGAHGGLPCLGAGTDIVLLYFEEGVDSVFLSLTPCRSFMLIFRPAAAAPAGGFELGPPFSA
jgi:hypothetical protein